MKVPLESGEMVGRQLDPFVYTNKRVVSHANWNNNIEWEISHIKRLGSEKVWVKKVARDEGVSEATDVGGKCFTISALKKLVLLAHAAHEEDEPQKINHCKAINLYESLYGGEWEKKIAETAHMRKF
eukprot:5577155-Ditylum_brightwellii.AAC.1